MSQQPFSPWPCYTAEEAEAVSRVLLSNRVNYWTGDQGREFEKEFAAFVGTDYAVALANGTLALEAACRALGLGPDAEVIVPARTFIASASAVVNAGAVPVFADIDPDSQTLTVKTIERQLTERTRAVICVHLAGWPCDLDGIMALAEKYDLRIIEDCAQAHGARYQGRSVGSIGHIGCWSFCQDKIMTTAGEGGMATTSDRDLWSAIWSYKDHGKSWDAVHRPDYPPGFRWLHESFGSNWRMTEIQAAVGRIQLRRLPDWHASRVAKAEKIWRVASRLPGLRVPERPAEIDHAAYKCYLFVVPETLAPGWSRDRIISWLNGQGIPCFSGSCPEVYREKAFAGTPWQPCHRLPVAARLGETSLMFPVHPTLTDVEIEKICDGLTRVMGRATRGA